MLALKFNLGTKIPYWEGAENNMKPGPVPCTPKASPGSVQRNSSFTKKSNPSKELVVHQDMKEGKKGELKLEKQPKCSCW